MKNKELNKEIKKIAERDNEKVYYRRIGKCYPSKCGGSCCRYAISKHSTKDSIYHKNVECSNSKIVEIKIIKKGILKGSELVVMPNLCPYITIDGRCKLHGKKSQPSVCEKFPMTPHDGVYEYIKKFCGYKFIKVKNKKYKRKKKGKLTKWKKLNRETIKWKQKR